MPEPTSGRGPLSHSSRSAYLAGCRCDGCRRANRAYVTAWRRARGVAPLKRGPQTPHGTLSRYHYCHCQLCRAANAARTRSRRVRLRSS